MLVDDLEVHEEMRRQRFELEVGALHRDLRLLADIGDQRFEQTARAELRTAVTIDETRREFRQRHDMTTQLLRQRLQQQLRLFLQHAGHEPFGAARIDLVQAVERHGERHAIARRTGLEVIGQRHLDAGHRHALREQVGRDAGGFVAHQVVAREEQEARLARLLFVAIPALERGARVDALRHERIVEREDQFVVDEHVLAARLVLQLLDIRDELAVVREERQPGVELAFDERAADEQLPRARRVLLAEAHAPPRIDGQPVQRRALEGRDLRRLLLPMRLGKRTAQQMRPDLLQPLGFDLRDRARIQPARLDQLARHHPAPRFLQQRRPGPQIELDAARAEVIRLVVGFEADVAEQAGQERQMHLLERRLRFVQPPAVLAHHRQQLRMHVAPLAQTQMRQEVRAARVRQLLVRLLVRDRVLEPGPDARPLQEFGTLVDELPVRLIRLLLRFDRAVARVLHGQRRRDDQHLAQRLMIARGENHPPDARVERQAREFAAERRERVVVIDGAEFVQQLIAVGDGAARRRFDERKRFDRRQVQRFHPQDDGRERRAQDFGIGETHARLEIGFVVETDAHAVRDTPAAARALVRRRLRDRLDLQLLDLVPVRIALHARHAGIDDIADARHRQRGFRDVGREHDAPRVRWLEHALLLGGRRGARRAAGFPCAADGAFGALRRRRGSRARREGTRGRRRSLRGRVHRRHRRSLPSGRDRSRARFSGAAPSAACPARSSPPDCLPAPAGSALPRETSARSLRSPAPVSRRCRNGGRSGRRRSWPRSRSASGRAGAAGSPSDSRAGNRY